MRSSVTVWKVARIIFLLYSFPYIFNTGFYIENKYIFYIIFLYHYFWRKNPTFQRYHEPCGFRLHS